MVPVAAPQPSILLFLSLACNGNWNKPDCRLTRLKSWRNGISLKWDASTSCQLITALQTYLRANALLHISPSCRTTAHMLKWERHRQHCWFTHTLPWETKRWTDFWGNECQSQNLWWWCNYGEERTMKVFGKCEGSNIFLIPFKSFIVSRPMSCKNSSKDTPGAPSKQTLLR